MTRLIYSKLLLLLLLFVAAEPLSAAQMERSEIVAAYVYRLAERIYWPNENKIQEYRIHIIDSDDEVSGSLRAKFGGNKLHDKTFRVTRSANKAVPEGSMWFTFQGNSIRLIRKYSGSLRDVQPC